MTPVSILVLMDVPFKPIYASNPLKIAIFNQFFKMPFLVKRYHIFTFFPMLLAPFTCIDRLPISQ